MWYDNYIYIFYNNLVEMRFCEQPEVDQDIVFIFYYKTEKHSVGWSSKSQML